MGRIEDLEAALREACEIAKAHIFVPTPRTHAGGMVGAQPLADPMAVLPIGGACAYQMGETFSVTIDSGAPYRARARVEALLRLASCAICGAPDKHGPDYERFTDDERLEHQVNEEACSG
jgi:hypothetical protein